MAIIKYLIKKANGDIVTVNSTSCTVVTQTTPTENDFLNNGMDDLNILNSAINGFNPKVDLGNCTVLVFKK